MSEKESRLVEQHRGLIVRVAQRYRWSGADMDDLIQAGRIGFLLGARRWKPGRGQSLPSYALLYARAEIEREAEMGGVVRFPMSSQENVARLREARQALGEQASDEALRGYLRWSARKLACVARHENWKSAVSMDALVAGTDEITIGESIIDTAPGPERQALARLEAQELLGMLGDLDKALVLGWARGESAASIGAALGLTTSNAASRLQQARYACATGGRHYVEDGLKGCRVPMEWSNRAQGGKS